MNDHFFFALLFFIIGFVTILVLYILSMIKNRKLRKQVEKWQQKYQQSEEGWFRRFKELEKTKQHG